MSSSRLGWSEVHLWAVPNTQVLTAGHMCQLLVLPVTEVSLGISSRDITHHVPSCRKGEQGEKGLTVGAAARVWVPFLERVS